MPATFTHFLVVEEALDRFRERRRGDPAAIALDDRFAFALVGSIGPDYPFLAERLGRANGQWGHRMHFENTGAVVNKGLELLGGIGGDDRDRCLAWLFGFATHLIADSIMHPVVNLAVNGIAMFTEEQHGDCEIVQDCWLFQDRTRRELQRTDYIGQLRDCSDGRNHDRLHPTLRDFWKGALRGAHPEADTDALNAIDPDAWHSALIGIMPWASVDPVPLLRHIARLAGQEHRQYRLSTQLSPADVGKYVTHARIPDGRGGATRGHINTVLDRIVDEVVRTWEALADGIADPGRWMSLPNRDLDTGAEVPRWDEVPELDLLVYWQPEQELEA